MKPIIIESSSQGIFSKSIPKSYLIQDQGDYLEVFPPDGGSVKRIKYSEISHIWVLRYTVNGVLSHHSILACVQGRKVDVVRSYRDIPEDSCNAVVSLVKTHNPMVILTHPDPDKAETTIAKVIMMCVLAPFVWVISAATVGVIFSYIKVLFRLDPQHCVVCKVVGGFLGLCIFVLSVAMTVIICRFVWRKAKVTHHHGGEEFSP